MLQFNRHHYGVKFAILIIIASLTSGCASLVAVNVLKNLYTDKAPWHRLNKLRSLSIMSQFDANYDSPVLLDVAFIYDDLLFNQLLSISVEDWFHNQSGITGLHPEDLLIVPFELVPLSYLKEVELPKRHKKALHILVFARYLKMNDTHMAKIGDYENVRLVLKKKGIEVLSVDD